MRFKSTLLAVAVACHLVDAYAAEDGKNAGRTPKIAVFVFPSGSCREAKVADSLIPKGTEGIYAIETASSKSKDEPPASLKEIEERATREEKKAREAALAFDLLAAAQIWRKAADELAKTEASALSRNTVASYLIEAGAASAEASEHDLAIQYFRKAVSIDCDARPGPSISPKVGSSFETALAIGPARSSAPNNAMLLRLAESVGADGVLWISIYKEEDGLQASRKLFLKNGEAAEPETSQNVPDAETDLKRWADRERNKIDMSISMALQPDQRREDEAKPWYKKWWVYAVAGGAIAAGAVGIAVGLSAQPETADVVVHH